MALKKLEEYEWRSFFDRLSKGLAGKGAKLERASLGIGREVEGKWIPLLGIAYHPKDDLVGIALEGHNHLIRKPREIWVDDDGPSGLTCMGVIDADGGRHILLLHNALTLPPVGRRDEIGQR